MKKIFLILMSMLLIFNMIACNPAAHDAIFDKISAPLLISEPADTPAPTAIPSDWQPYDGDGSKYEYIWTNPRDSEIEKDIITFADKFLDPWHGHNKFVNIETPHEIQDIGMALKSELWNEYDDELRTKFIQTINNILINIPNLDINELRYSLSSALALLNDVHSNIYSHSFRLCFPVYFEIVEMDGHIDYCVSLIKKNYSKVLFSKLKAINGVSTYELIELARPVIPHETEDGLIAKLFSDFIYYADFLHYIGVIGNENSALFTFEDEDGEIIDIPLTAKKHFAYEDIAFPDFIYDLESPPFAYGMLDSYFDEDHWFTYVEEYDTVYIRFNSCNMYDENDLIYDFVAFMDEIRTLIDEVNGIDKLIVDFRNNGGGHYVDETRRELFSAIRDIYAPGGKYLLIDRNSYSSAVLWPAAIKRHFSDKPELGEIIIAGTPAAEPPFCYSIADTPYEMESLNAYYNIGSFYISSWEYYPYEAFMPDEGWWIEQSYKDLLDGYDSLLKAIFEAD